MQFKDEKAATEITSEESVQTKVAESSHQQSFTELGAAGKEAAATTSRSITAADTQANSGGTNVPAEFRFTETQYEPGEGVTSEQLSKLSQNDLLTGLAKQYRKTRESHGQFGRDLSVLVLFYDHVVAICKEERVSVNRDGKPTLREAFAAVGWNYEAARKMKQRYNASMAALPDYASAQKPLRLTEGDLVMEKGKDGVYAVINVHAPSPVDIPVVDIAPEGKSDAKTVTITTDLLKKVNKPVRKVKVGERLLCEDTGAEYEYDGKGKFSRTKTPTLLEQKREREIASIKAKQEREKAKAKEKQRQKELRNAEAVRRDLDKLAEKERRKAEAEAKKQGARNKKAELAAKKAARTKKEPAATPTEAEKVLVARIGNTNEFGVFPESETEHTTAKALAIGMRQYCEAERDRINANRVPTAGSLGNVVDVVNTHVPQEAVGLL